MSFNDWLRGKNRGETQEDGDVEFYEDTHDAEGNYVGKQAAPASARSRLFSPQSVQQPVRTQPPTASAAESRPMYGNIVVYRPSTPEEVETLINFLKKGEPAVVNLNELDETDAQRILDFLSGAIYALSGNIHCITGNIFLLSPSGVEIQSYYDKQ